MELTCPACGKKNDTASNCPRCGCEVSNLHELTKASVSLYDESCSLLQKGNAYDALKKAEISWDLVNSEKTAAIAFVASISLSDSAVSLQWWNRAQPATNGNL
jgi:hypothetical protein